MLIRNNEDHGSFHADTERESGMGYDQPEIWAVAVIAGPVILGLALFYGVKHRGRYKLPADGQGPNVLETSAPPQANTPFQSQESSVPR